MRTLEEIKEHLSTTVYDEESKQVITGFLIGKEIGKEEGSLDIEFVLPRDFDDFMEWFNEPKEKSTETKGLENGTKYKYLGKEREDLINQREKLRKIIGEAVSDFIDNLTIFDDFSSLTLKNILDSYEKDLKDIEYRLNETVD